MQDGRTILAYNAMYDTLYVAASNRVLYALDPSTGQVKWEWDGNPSAPFLTILSGDDKVFVTGGGSPGSCQSTGRR